MTNFQAKYYSHFQPYIYQCKSAHENYGDVNIFCLTWVKRKFSFCRYYQPRNAKSTLLSRAQVNPNVEVIIKFYWAIIQIPYTLRRYVLGVLSRYETNRLRADKMMA